MNFSSNTGPSKRRARKFNNSNNGSRNWNNSSPRKPKASHEDTSMEAEGRRMAGTQRLGVRSRPVGAAFGRRQTFRSSTQCRRADAAQNLAAEPDLFLISAFSLRVSGQSC